MVNKTPDCNELFKEYCGILDSWYNQKLSKEIDMRVEQKLNEINYDRIKCDKIIKLLENLHVEPLFDINEDMETKLFKLVAEILRLQGKIKKKVYIYIYLSVLFLSLFFFFFF